MSIPNTFAVIVCGCSPLGLNELDKLLTIFVITFMLVFCHGSLSTLKDSVSLRGRSTSPVIDVSQSHFPRNPPNSTGKYESILKITKSFKTFFQTAEADILESFQRLTSPDYGVESKNNSQSSRLLKAETSTHGRKSKIRLKA